MDPLDSLEEKIRQAKARESEGKTTSQQDATAMGRAMSYATELLAGVLVGGVVGFFADRWLHTSPILFIVMFFLGAAAGFRNLMRRVKAESDQDKET